MNNSDTNNNYCYLIQEREFIKTGEPIYKIGKTSQGYSKRVSQYPKNSVVVAITKVNDCNISEKNIIKCFNLKFKRRTDIGLEYYEGDIDVMLDEFNKIVSNISKNSYNNTNNSNNNIINNNVKLIDVMNNSKNTDNAKYICKCCMFETNFGGNWHHYKKTKKHIRLYKKQNELNKQNNSTNIHHENTSLSVDQKELYEKALKDKDEQINLLKQLIKIQDIKIN